MVHGNRLGVLSLMYRMTMALPGQIGCRFSEFSGNDTSGTCSRADMQVSGRVSVAGWPRERVLFSKGENHDKPSKALLLIHSASILVLLSGCLNC